MAAATEADLTPPGKPPLVASGADEADRRDVLAQVAGQITAPWDDMAALLRCEGYL